MIIKNARIYTPEHTFKTGDLTIRDGRIAFGAPPLEGEEVLDANGAYALPGLVDIHFHGAVGHDFCDADEAGLQAIADLPRHHDVQRGDFERHYGCGRRPQERSGC